MKDSNPTTQQAIDNIKAVLTEMILDSWIWEFTVKVTNWLARVLSKLEKVARK